MILYVDTSDLFKMFVLESGSQRVDRSVFASDRLASSLLAYVEMRAALAAAFRDQRLDEAAHLSALANFERQWLRFIKVNLSRALISRAGALAPSHALKASDSIHLSAAMFLRETHADEVRFSVSDGRLKAAAIIEGFVVV